ncbi:GDSL-type esterase/lipase family protein [Paraglaciecola hydrolytica]|uniref:CBM6 domain-containing protein n=1 Tax=Paraglaciecola hydrolytica TaxID=1799789 RepID=A0A148KM35_9ALTE|nr:GDSL-type esterase/lipase family protein [Paraglaciecola hydrolytica]KXI27357.1 hypothetical protein AX660_21800 [Paraglaciecola hydrolytica]
MRKYLVLSVLLLSINGCGGQGSTDIGSTAPPVIIAQPESPEVPVTPSTPETPEVPTTPDPGELLLEEMQAGFCSVSGLIENTHTGFTGEGFANTDNQVDAQIKWQVNATTAGDYNIELVYAAPTARPSTLSSNGSESALAFVSSTAWDIWSVDTAVITLVAGENDIVLSANTAEGAPNIDSLKILGQGLSAGACSFTPTTPTEPPSEANTQIYIIGDSTVANYGASYYPQKGWGQVLQHFFKNREVEVVNRARGGRSSRSFYSEVGLWDEVLKELDSGDYLLIQFGHNDRDWSEETRFTPPADFEQYLANYVNEARAKGVTPILVSPMVMNAYNGDVLRNVFTEDGNDYRGSMAKVATDMDVAFVDLNIKSFDLVKALGQQQASHYLYLILDAGEYPNYPAGSNDGTHFQESGAVEMARLVVEGLEELRNRVDIEPLIANVKHRYTLSVDNVGANTSILTQGNAYPEGIPLTFKTIAGETDTFNAWYSWGLIVSEGNIFQTTMPANKYSLTAAFNGAVPVVNFSAATVFVIGDSTVADYTSGYFPQTGWGQVLQPFFDDNKITIDNRAIGGTSSKSFYAEFWQSVKADIREGDFVFIQFGINDRANDEDRAAPSGGVFEGYLSSYIEETQALGATPVLISSVRRNQWQNGTPYDAYHEHPVVTRELAATLGVALIDLDSKNKALLVSVGETYANQFYYMGLAANEYENFKNGISDTVHFQQAGAVEMARLVAQGIAELSSRQTIAPLIDALKPVYVLNISSPTPDAGVITQGFAYPQGSPLTIKAVANSDNVFTQWLDKNSAEVANKSIYQFTAKDNDTEFTAVFNNSEGLGIPTNNLVAVLDGTKVNLSWDLQNYDPAITYLEVYRNDKNDVAGRTRIVAGATPKGNFVDETGVEGTTYWYMFKIVQDTVTTNTTPEAETRIPFVNEIPVTNLSAQIDGTAVNLSWDLQYFEPEITYLEVYRNDKNEALGRTRIVPGATLNGTFRDEGLEPGKTYWYMFKMVQDGVTANTAPEAETTIPADAVPSTPTEPGEPSDPETPTEPVEPTEPPVTNLTTVVNGNNVTVSWDLQNFSPEITYLEVYRNDKNGTAGRTRIVAGAALAGSFVDEGLTSGLTYWYMFKMVQDGVTSNTEPDAPTTIP